MGRPPRPLKLTDDERTTLTMWVSAGKTEVRIAQRARTILLFAQGLPWAQITEQTGLSQTNSMKWVRRFRAERLEGLSDRRRTGRPPRGRLSAARDGLGLY